MYKVCGVLKFISKGNTTIVIGGCRAVRGIINDFLIHPNSQTQSSNNNYHPMKFRKNIYVEKTGIFYQIEKKTSSNHNKMDTKIMVLKSRFQKYTSLLVYLK